VITSVLPTRRQTLLLAVTTVAEFVILKRIFINDTYPQMPYLKAIEVFYR